jgi:hypothetical protein
MKLSDLTNAQGRSPWINPDPNFLDKEVKQGEWVCYEKTMSGKATFIVVGKTATDWKQVKGYFLDNAGLPDFVDGTPAQKGYAASIRAYFLLSGSGESQKHRVLAEAATKIVNSVQDYLKWSGTDKLENLAIALRRSAKRIDPGYDAILNDPQKHQPVDSRPSFF